MYLKRLTSTPNTLSSVHQQCTWCALLWFLPLAWPVWLPQPTKSPKSSPRPSTSGHSAPAAGALQLLAHHGGAEQPGPSPARSLQGQLLLAFPALELCLSALFCRYFGICWGLFCFVALFTFKKSIVRQQKPAWEQQSKRTPFLYPFSLSPNPTAAPQPPPAPPGAAHGAGPGLHPMASAR